MQRPAFHRAQLEVDHDTGTPKPVPYSNFFLSVFDAHRFLPGKDGRPACGLHLYGGASHFFTAFPFFHLAGLAGSMAPIWYDCTVVLPPAGLPATGKLVVDVMAAVGLETMFCPPSIIEDMVRDHLDEFIKSSGSLKAVVFGGGRSHGVSCIYGSY